MKNFVWITFFLFIFISCVYANDTDSIDASSMTYEKFTDNLKSFNAEIAKLQQQQLPFIYKRYCITDTEEITTSNKNKVLCGILYRNASFTLQDEIDGNWTIDNLVKGEKFLHFIDKAHVYNFIRPQVFAKEEGFVTLSDVYFAAPDFKVFFWKVPEKIGGEESWLFKYRNNNTTYTYHISQRTGFIIASDILRYEFTEGKNLQIGYDKTLFRDFYEVQTKVDLPDSFFLDKIKGTFRSYELQTLIDLFYQFFLPLLWLVFFAWLFTRLIIVNHPLSARLKTGIFIFAMMEPFFMGSIFFLITNGAYMDWMIYIGDTVRKFFENALAGSPQQLRFAISSFNAIFAVDAVHIVLSLAIAYPLVHLVLIRHWRQK